MTMAKDGPKTPGNLKGQNVSNTTHSLKWAGTKANPSLRTAALGKPKVQKL